MQYWQRATPSTNRHVQTKVLMTTTYNQPVFMFLFLFFCLVFFTSLDLFFPKKNVVSKKTSQNADDEKTYRLRLEQMLEHNVN